MWTADVAWAMAAAAIASLVAVWVLELWDGWAPSRPLSYTGDSYYYFGVVKGVLDHGWYLNNPSLGAPFGLESHDFPVVSNDALQLLIIKVLGLFLGSAFTVTNAFYLLTYPLTAVTAFSALRLLRVSRLPALVAAVLFATTPYHFLKGEVHLFFASFYLVPFSCLLVLAVMAGEPLFTRRPGARGLRAWATRRTLGVLLLCALIAAASIYYAVFTALLVGSASVLRAIVAGRVRAVATGAVVVAVIAGSAVALQTPTIIYRLQHGPNSVAQRTGADTEYWALKLDQLVFPVYGHRIDRLARFTDDYQAETRMLGEPSAFLGAVGTVGLAWLLAVGLAAVPAGRARRLGTRKERHAAAAVLVAFLFATAGGISAVIGYALTPQIRGWSRISPFVAFFALLAVALLLERLRPSRARPVAAAAVVGVLVLGVVEQTSPRFAPDHDAIRVAYANDAGYVHAVERQLPAGSMVLQLPYSPYPENPRFWAGSDYLHMLGYLHSSRLRWSYGAMKGRPEDWHASLEEVPLRALVDGAAAAGFRGIHVDRRGYGDHARGLESALTRLLGPPAVASADGNLVFWDLEDERAILPADRREAMSEATVTPVRVEYGSGVSYSEGAASDRWRWADRHAEIVLTNPHDGPRRLVLDVVLRTDVEAPGRTTVTFPDGTTRTVPIDREGTRVLRAFDAPPGRSLLRFDTDSLQVPTGPGDLRTLFVQLRRPVLMPEALCIPPARSTRSLRACIESPREQLP